MSDEAQAINDDTKEQLEVVKKGKSRRFVLLYKGGAVSSLVVFKKGSLKARVTEAKQAGAGEVFHGVVSSDGGLNLKFSFARSDGFDAPPGKEAKLRELFQEEGLKYKATYELVNEPPAIAFDEDDDHPLVVRFQKLAPAVSGLLDERPDLTAEMALRVKELRLQLQDEEQRDDAGPKLDELENLLRSPPQPVAGPTAPSESNDERRQRLLDALEKLTPAIQTAVKARPELKAKVVELSTQFQGQLKKAEFDAAQDTLLALGRVIKGPASVQPSDGPNEKPADKSENKAGKADWDRAWGTLEPRYQAALRSVSPEVAGKLRVLATYAVEQAEAGQFDKALGALTRLKPLLDQVAAQPSQQQPSQQQPGPFVVLQQCRLSWTETRRLVRSELEKLEAAILAACKAEADFNEISEGTSNLFFMLDVLDDSLTDALDDALNAADPKKRHAFHREARAIVDEYVDFVSTDDLIQAIDENGFTPVAVCSTLTTKLQELKSKLTV